MALWLPPPGDTCQGPGQLSYAPPIKVAAAARQLSDEWVACNPLMQEVPVDRIDVSQASMSGVLTCTALECVGAPQVKMHWVHENYWQPGPQGNDIQKTNVPNLRMRFRYDNHQEEVRLQSRPGD